jgi:octaprenyl-diphosphate synthase
MWQFGIDLGIIFQIIDDLLDYIGNEQATGKNIGSDFFEGKVTLPLILLYKKTDILNRDRIDIMIARDERSESELLLIQQLFIDHDIKSEIMSYLNELKLKALALLKNLHIDNLCNAYLVKLVDFTINRSN